MLYRGTGKAEHGYRIAVVMDPDSRLILGYSVNTWHKEKPKKGQLYSELEKDAMEMASAALMQYGRADRIADLQDTSKSKYASSFFSAMAKEQLWRYDYRTLDELKALVDDYVSYYNNKRIHSSLNYKTPAEVWFDNI